MHSSSLARRRELRAASTDAEAALWQRLRAKRFAGFKFRRQHPCGPYVLDFYCPVLRFPSDLVFRELTGLLDAITLTLGVGPSPPQAGRGNGILLRGGRRF